MAFTTDKDLQNRHYGPLIGTSIGLFVVIMGFAFWQARPLYRWAQTQRALRLIHPIKEHTANENFVDAHKLAYDAYHMAPNEPAVLRTCAHLAMAMKSPESRFFLEKIVESGEATFEDRTTLLEAYFRLAETDRVNNLANQLYQENPNDLPLLKLLVEIFGSQEKPAEAMHVLARIVELDPDDPKHRLLYARLLILHGGGSDRDKGWQFVWKVAQDDGEYGLAAIDLLLQGTGFPPEMNALIVERIASHPLTQEKHHVASIELQCQLHPDRRPQIIAEALAHRADWPAKELSPFFRWLSQEKEFPLILENLAFEKAKGTQDLLVVYLNAIGHAGQWEEVRKQLADPSLPLSEPTRLMFSALCAQKLGEDETVIEEFLQKSLNTATRHGSFDQAFNTATFAEAAGLPEVAEMAYHLSLRSNSVANRAYEGLQRLAEAEGDTMKLRNVTASYHYRFPRRAEIGERFLYLNALVGIELETTLEKSLALVEAEPYRSAPRITAALALLRMHDVASAAKACEPCNPAELSASQKAVYAAVAGAAGKADLARQVAAQAETAGLLKEEEMLLAPWRPL